MLYASPPPARAYMYISINALYTEFISLFLRCRVVSIVRYLYTIRIHVLAMGFRRVNIKP